MPGRQAYNENFILHGLRKYAIKSKPLKFKKMSRDRSFTAIYKTVRKQGKIFWDTKDSGMHMSKRIRTLIPHLVHIICILYIYIICTCIYVTVLIRVHTLCTFIRNADGKILKPAPFQSSVKSGQVARVEPKVW